MKFAYDYEILAENGTSKIVMVHTGNDREKARRGAVKASRDHGRAALLYLDPSGEAQGALTYVDGALASRDGVTRKVAA